MFTENLFVEGNDAWHHQMAYGIKDEKIYLTNPMNQIPVSQMITFLTAGQWMIIPRKHIMERDIDDKDFLELMEEKWSRFNVLERALSLKKGRVATFNGNSCYDGLTIPYGGIAGISAFCQKDNVDGMKFLEKYTKNEEDIFLPIYQKNVKANRLNI